MIFTVYNTLTWINRNIQEHKKKLKKKKKTPSKTINYNKYKIKYKEAWNWLNRI